MGDAALQLRQAMALLSVRLKLPDAPFRFLHRRFAGAHDALRRPGPAPYDGDATAFFLATLAEFGAVLQRFIAMTLLDQLLGNAKLERALAALHEALDRLGQRLGVEPIAWRPQLAHELDAQMRAIEQGLQPLRLLAAKLRSDPKRRHDALVLLQAELAKIPQRASALPPQAVQLVAKMCDAIKRASPDNVPDVPPWLLLEADLTFSERPFAHGSLGAVRRGEWAHGNKKIVVKMLLPSENDALELRQYAPLVEELGARAGCQHPHVVAFVGACHVGSRPFLVYEEAANGDVAAYLRRSASKNQLWPLLFEASQGLAYLHTNKIVHGGLKMNNILVDGDGCALVADFGLARLRAKCQSTQQQRSSGRRDVRWTAPECLAGGDATFASDVYSLGMCIIAAVDGGPPYGTLDDKAIEQHVRRGELPPRPSAIADEEWALVRAMMMPIPEQRLALADVVRALHVFADRPVKDSLPRSRRVLPPRDDPEAEVADHGLPLCEYKGKPCLRPRALSKRHTDGTRSKLCEIHRAAANEFQRKYADRKRRETRLKGGVRQATAAAAPSSATDSDLGEDTTTAEQRTNVEPAQAEAVVARAEEPEAASQSVESALTARLETENGASILQSLALLAVLADKKTAASSRPAVASRPPTEEKRVAVEQVLPVVPMGPALPSHRERNELPAWFLPKGEVTFDIRAFANVKNVSFHRGVRRDQTPVVIKRFMSDTAASHAEAMAAFAREADLWSTFNHPHLLKLYGACTSTERPFFVCEGAYIPATIDFRTASELEKRLVWRLLHEAAQALAHLHRSRIVLGRLDLESILIGADGRARLTDFSRSRAATFRDVHAAQEVFDFDVYLLVMCIVEAVQDRPPYASVRRAVVHSMVKGSAPPNRPAAIPDAAWELVVRVTESRHSRERVDLETVLSTLDALAAICRACWASLRDGNDACPACGNTRKEIAVICSPHADTSMASRMEIPSGGDGVDQLVPASSVDSDAEMEAAADNSEASDSAGDESSSSSSVPASALCGYPGRACLLPRAKKLDGSLHRLCNDHRSQQNLRQRRSAQRKLLCQYVGDGVNCDEPRIRSHEDVLLVFCEKHSEVNGQSQSASQGLDKAKRRREENDAQTATETDTTVKAGRVELSRVGNAGVIDRTLVGILGDAAAYPYHLAVHASRGDAAAFMQSLVKIDSKTAAPPSASTAVRFRRATKTRTALCAAEYAYYMDYRELGDYIVTQMAQPPDDCDLLPAVSITFVEDVEEYGYVFAVRESRGSVDDFKDFADVVDGARHSLEATILADVEHEQLLTVELSTKDLAIQLGYLDVLKVWLREMCPEMPAKVKFDAIKQAKVHMGGATA